MRPPLTVGILAEKKNMWERRAPLTPTDVAWLHARNIPTEVVANSKRIHANDTYRRSGAKIVKTLEEAGLILGVKEPPIEDIKENKVYMTFSHTAKGQKQNLPLLKAFLHKKATLIDFEYIKDRRGERMVYFGRFAGICGMIDSLHCMGKRLSSKGIATPFSDIKHSLEYGSLEKAMGPLKRIAKIIRKKGLDDRISPFIIGIMGHGNVSKGAQEILDLFGPLEIHPQDLLILLKGKQKIRHGLFKIIFDREEKYRSTDGHRFYFEEYLKDPKKFESNMDRFLPHLNLLLNCSYWDKRFPRLVTKEMIDTLYMKHKSFRLSVIADLSCDIQGGIEITRKVSPPNQPSYIYDPKTGQIHDDSSKDGIMVMAVDHLPCEFPRESTEEFSQSIRDYVYQIAFHGVKDVTEHHALPLEIRQAVITQDGKLTDNFQHLSKFL
jgi:saccharopine dehydrogenase (NAD+, L-lysine forming)